MPSGIVIQLPIFNNVFLLTSIFWAFHVQNIVEYATKVEIFQNFVDHSLIFRPPYGPDLTRVTVNSTLTTALLVANKTETRFICLLLVFNDL